MATVLLKEMALFEHDMSNSSEILEINAVHKFSLHALFSSLLVVICYLLLVVSDKHLKDNYLSNDSDGIWLLEDGGGGGGGGRNFQ